MGNANKEYIRAGRSASIMLSEARTTLMPKKSASIRLTMSFIWACIMIYRS